MSASPPPERRETAADHHDPTPLWIVGLIIFGVAGIGGPVLFLILNFVIPDGAAR